MIENDEILEGLLLEWENFHSISLHKQKQSSKPKPDHQIKQQWSMVMIRDSLPHNDLSIFPPINHENLHHQIQQQQQQQQQDPTSKSTLLPPSGASDVIPSSADRGIGEWLAIGLEILRAKTVSLACYFGYENGTIGRAFRSFRGVIDVAAVVVVVQAGTPAEMSERERGTVEDDYKVEGRENCRVVKLDCSNESSIGSTS